MIHEENWDERWELCALCIPQEHKVWKHKQVHPPAAFWLTGGPWAAIAERALAAMLRVIGDAGISFEQFDAGLGIASIPPKIKEAVLQAQSDVLGVSGIAAAHKLRDSLVAMRRLEEAQLSFHNKQQAVIADLQSAFGAGDWTEFGVDQGQVDKWIQS